LLADVRNTNISRGGGGLSSPSGTSLMITVTLLLAALALLVSIDDSSGAEI
jgi:hypothetical protein